VAISSFMAFLLIPQSGIGYSTLLTTFQSPAPFLTLPVAG
jgi:hypothetical protein